jgi:hypothetical protein
MQAYEFYTKPKNGIIQIPENYKNLITEDVMVIILEKKSAPVVNLEANKQRKTDVLSPPVLKTKGWKFDREEANAR